MPSTHTVLRSTEALAIFAALPLVNTFKTRIPPVVALGVLGVYLVAILATDKTFEPKHHHNPHAVVTHAPYIALKTVGTALAVAVLARKVTPDEFLAPIRTNRKALAKELALYWTLSVVPQELLYRTFFYHRYKGEIPAHLFGVINAAAFGFAHVIFKNAMAPLLTFGAGILFAHSYERHRSLPLVSLEHALYGSLLFALGMGKYFTFAEVPAIK